MNAKLTERSSTPPLAPYDTTIDGHPLSVTPGATGGGRYWQLTTPGGVPAGMVAEHVTAGTLVYEALAGTQHTTADSFDAAARSIVAVLMAGAA